MIKYISILLLVASTTLADEGDRIDPVSVLNSEGLLVVSDGSSIYRFNKDRTFYSHPIGMCGRAFRGTWSAKDNQPTKFTAIAEYYWQNGSSAVDDYREITFLIYPGQNRPSSPRRIGEAGYKQIFDCYFIIEELKKITKPENAQQPLSPR